jgi:hypothetical protein
MKYTILAFAFFTLPLRAEILNFSDGVDVVPDTPSGSYFLDASPYANTVIGKGAWDVAADPFSPISSLNINHYIFLFGAGSLESVTVHGITSTEVNLVVNSGMPDEQTFLGESGILPNEYFFDLNGYNLNQGGSTLFVGFDSIDSINFTGTYTAVPEPASAGVLMGALALASASGRRRTSGSK